MTECWVINASPLILLAKIGHHHLLGQLVDELIVPQAVVDEINAGPHDDAARQLLADSPLPIVPVVANPRVLTWDRGAGETAVLSFACDHPGWRVVIDDGAARRCAPALGIPLIGTLGVILRARKANLIPSAASLLKSLLVHGYRLDEALIRTALLQTVGEAWV